MNELKPVKSVANRTAQTAIVVRGNATNITTATFMSRVYLWMTLGLFVTGSAAYFVAQSPAAINWIINTPHVFAILLGVQIGVVIILSIFIKKLNPIIATLIYLAYTLLTGLTFSVIFLVYTLGSISSVFFLTVFSFAGLSAFGYLTGRDLTGLGSFCIMGLFGLIGITLLSFFIPSLMSETIQLATAVAGVIIFSGLTAYDTQKIKQYNSAEADSRQLQKGAILGALNLYLDFINLFLSLLRLFGRRR